MQNKQIKLGWKEITCHFCGKHLGYIQVENDAHKISCCKDCF